MAKSYVKFEVSKEVAEKALDAVRLAKQSGTVRKGVNEVTKSVERGLASLVVIAEDIDPEEVVIHLPKLCEQRKIAFVYVPAKEGLGKAIGMSVPCTSVAIEKAGEAEAAIKDVISKVSGKVQAHAAEGSGKSEKKAEETKQAKESKSK